MRLHHSAIPKPDPIRIPTTRTPITAYAYCGDCGADAGTACVDENLKPCMMCPGRVLAGGADKGAYQRAEYKRRKVVRLQPTTVERPCWHCGVTCHAPSSRITITVCDAERCQQALVRENRRRWKPGTARYQCTVCGIAYAAKAHCGRSLTCGAECSKTRAAAVQKANRKTLAPMVCCICGIGIPAGNGRASKSRLPCCSERKCRLARQREYDKAAPPRVRVRRKVKPPADNPA